jgi:ubiquinone/menaquinone biosynthesis C-methylase UbiE
MSYLKDLESSWNKLGQKDPLWAISTDPSKKNNKWDLDDFFNSGIREIDALMEYIEGLQIPIRTKKALDFGCGVGRLTQALASYFDVVEGIDIAPSMVELARKLNRYGDRCKYHVNPNIDLYLYDDEVFDLIYTSYVLQHIRTDYSKKYIKELLRILAPDGILVFSMLSTANTLFGEFHFVVKYPLQRIYARVYSKLKGSVMESHFIKRDQLIQLLEANGAKLIDITEITETKYWHNSRYCVVKA